MEEQNEKKMNDNSIHDAYCPNCDAYLCAKKVTYEETCDYCGTEVEWE